MARPVRKGKNWPYRSGFEKRMAEFLNTNGIPFTYETHTFPIVVEIPKTFCGSCASNEIRQRTVYTPDFVLGSAENPVFIEGKGRMSAKEKRRILGLLGSHPGIDFRLVFMRNNPIYPRSKTKYMDWAKDNNIPACIGPELPKAWVTEFKPKKRRSKNGTT